MPKAARKVTIAIATTVVGGLIVQFCTHLIWRQPQPTVNGASAARPSLSPALALGTIDVHKPVLVGFHFRDSNQFSRDTIFDPKDQYRWAYYCLVFQNKSSVTVGDIRVTLQFSSTCRMSELFADAGFSYEAANGTFVSMPKSRRIDLQQKEREVCLRLQKLPPGLTSSILVSLYRPSGELLLDPTVNVYCDEGELTPFKMQSLPSWIRVPE